MANVFHSELMNEAKHLESVTVVVVENMKKQGQVLGQEQGKSDCNQKEDHPEPENSSIPASVMDLGEFSLEDIQKLGTYYCSSTPSQQETFYHNWQNHFQPK